MAYVRKGGENVKIGEASLLRKHQFGYIAKYYILSIQIVSLVEYQENQSNGSDYV